MHYHQTWRRMLLDMHIPDWDVDFLSAYDPAELADRYVESATQAVLIYCKSHLGLSYWPSPIGGIHPAARDRDLVGDLVADLENRGIATAAYHSVVYDNWAAIQHPDWRVAPAAELGPGGQAFNGPRYGTLCPNNLEYRDFEKQQIQALLRRYEFSTIWFDMTFWTGVCVCPSCASRWREESGLDIPRVLDWHDPVWAAFQSARERWMGDFVRFLQDVSIQARPGIRVVHNMASAFLGWFTGLRPSESAVDDFPAGDHHAGQFMISKLMQQMARGDLPEYMTTRTDNLGTHVAVKSEHRMLTDALGAVATGTAFLFIDAIDPVGTVNADVYRQMGRVYRSVEHYDEFLTGEPLNDVAVYYSADAAVNPDDDGLPLDQVRIAPERLPHLRAVNGATSILQTAHIDFTVVTELDLLRLSDFRVLIVPDLVRTTAREIEAFRAFVAGGGRLYISGRTATLSDDGHESEDFVLSDLIGAHLAGFEDGVGAYARAADEIIAAAGHPERYLGFGFDSSGVRGLPRLYPDARARVLASLSLPYAYPATGSLTGQDFASIHASPPWEDREEPVIVDNKVGAGRVIYSAFPFEASPVAGNRRAVEAMVRDLLDGPAALEGEAHPDFLITGRRQPGRLVLTALRRGDEPPAGSAPVTFRVRSVPGLRPAGPALDVDSGEEFPVTSTGGVWSVTAPSVSWFALIALPYEVEA